MECNLLTRLIRDGRAVAILFSLDGASSNLSLSIVHWRWVKVLPNYHFQNRFFPIDYWQHPRRIKSAEREGWWQKIAYGLGRNRKTFSNGGLLIQLCFSSLNQMTLSSLLSLTDFIHKGGWGDVSIQNKFAFVLRAHLSLFRKRGFLCVDSAVEILDQAESWVGGEMTAHLVLRTIYVMQNLQFYSWCGILSLQTHKYKYENMCASRNTKELQFQCKYKYKWWVLSPLTCSHA